MKTIVMSSGGIALALAASASASCPCQCHASATESPSAQGPLDHRLKHASVANDAGPPQTVFAGTKHQKTLLRHGASHQAMMSRTDRHRSSPPAFADSSPGAMTTAVNDTSTKQPRFGIASAHGGGRTKLADKYRPGDGHIDVGKGFAIAA